MVLIDLRLQGHLGLKRSKSAKNGLLHVIAPHTLESRSPNLHQICIMGPSRILLKMVLIDCDLQGHLGAQTVKSRPYMLVCTIKNHAFALSVYNVTLHNLVDDYVD